jgi:hypothetical protein
MIQSTKPQCSEAQRWQAETGEAFVESASEPGRLYAVSATTCSCPAGQRGIPCKHRACYLAQIGELPLEPETLIVVHVPALVDCAACNGCGSIYARSGGWKCDYCNGRGQVAVAPVPAVMPAATRSAVAA